MSGLEVAGVVLGVLPIVIKALSVYREEKGLFATMRKSRGLVDELIHKLSTQRTYFYLDILELLREARVPEILKEVDPPPDMCIEILQATKTGDEVKDFLGPHLYSQFLEIMGFYEDNLKDITSKLARVITDTGIHADKDDLSAIVQASKSPASLVFKGKVKFAIDRQSLGALVESLGSERYSLGKLIQRVKTKREWEASEPTSSSTMMSLAFSRVRTNATWLWRAACKCWICDQHELHTVMIRLEHRIPENKGRAASSSAVVFRLCFPIEDTVLQRIEVVSRCNETGAPKADSPLPQEQVTFRPHKTLRPKELTSSSTRSKTSDGALKIPSIMVTETPNVSHPGIARVRIESLCEDARKARENRRVLSLELTHSVALEMAEKDDKSPYSYDRSISLADFLKDTAADADARMTPMEQTLLALNVVSSVLQLRPTVWCNVPWNSSTIRFPVQATEGANITLCTPYVEQTIDPSALEGQESTIVEADLTTQAAKATMLELAILLLEILHHKPIAAWAARNNEDDPKTSLERMGAAMHWLELSTSKLLPPHVKAVQECLSMCVRSKLSWDEHFQRIYCENIIKPLQELVL